MEPANEGLPVWGLTIQNEPKATQRSDSCLYTAEQERDFVRDHLGPALRDAGLGDVKVMIWDHNKERLYDRARVAFEDPVASDYIWGVGFHWYSGDHFEAVAAVRDRWPDKALVFTEGCTLMRTGDGAWENAEQYGHDMIGNLNAGMAAWAEWNMVLDETGGPNHVGNFCEAPVIVHRLPDARWRARAGGAQPARRSGPLHAPRERPHRAGRTVGAQHRDARVLTRG